MIRFIKLLLAAGTWDKSKAPKVFPANFANIKQSFSLQNGHFCFQSSCQKKFWDSSYKKITGDTPDEIRESCANLAKEHVVAEGLDVKESDPPPDEREVSD